MNALSNRYWLASLYLPDIGPQTILRWLEHFDSIEQVFKASREEWQAAGIHPAHHAALQQPDWQRVEEDVAWANDPLHHIITIDDAAYPDLLKEIHSPPLVLFVKGDPAILKQSQIAMVGSRHPSPAGLRDAEEFAYQLAASGLVVTSGLALGIDGASHRGALRANGKTIGVMGTGLKHIYPVSHRTLAKDIIEKGGALVSEFPLTTSPFPQNFPRRNRTISGLSRGTLVVEAALKSGSLITARYASEQGRDVFAIPGSIHHPLARGCHALIQQGAKLVEKPEDIIVELGMSSLVPTQVSLPVDLPLNEHQLLMQIEHAMTPIDAIILRSGLTAGEVSSILLSLELQGYVQSVPGGYVRQIAS